MFSCPYLPHLANLCELCSEAPTQKVLQTYGLTNGHKWKAKKMLLGGILDAWHTFWYFWILLDTWHSEVANAAVPTCNFILHGNLANHSYVFINKPNHHSMYVLFWNWFDLIWVQNQISSGTKLTMQRVMRRLHLCLGEGSADIWSLTLGKIFNSLLISIIWFTFRKDYHYHWLIVINFAVMYNLFFVIGRSVFWELDSLFPRVRTRRVYFPENQGCISS